MKLKQGYWWSNNSYKACNNREWVYITIGNDYEEGYYRENAKHSIIENLYEIYWNMNNIGLVWSIISKSKSACSLFMESQNNLE
jgi:hypothetical protein